VLVLHLLLTMTCASQGDAVVARVDANAITAAEVAGKVKASGATVASALETLIGEAILADAARATKLEKSPDVRGPVDAERRRLAVERLLETSVYDGVTASDDEVSKLFHARADQAKLSMVVRATREEALEVQHRLRQGASLVDEARRSSDPLIASKSGFLGWVPRGALIPDLAAAVFATPLLVPAGPAPVSKGYAVFIVHERNLGRAPPKEDVAALRHSVELSKRADAVEAFSRRLRARSRAHVDATFIASTRDRIEASPEELRHPVATAGWVTVRYGEILGPLMETVGQNGRAPPVIKERLSTQLLDRKLLEAEAKARGLHRAPEVERALSRIERSLLASAYARRLAESLPAPTDAELEARYQKESGDFMTPARRACSGVMSKTEDEASRLRWRLALGEPLASVAKDSVDSRFAENGGDLGEITDTELEALGSSAGELGVAAMIRRSRPEEWTGPVRTRTGWVVLRCSAVKPGTLRPFSEVRSVLLERVQRERARRAVEGRVSELRGRAHVVIDERALAVVVAKSG
jgi:parvulin-like peptidyl-prolyl isomerase